MLRLGDVAALAQALELGRVGDAHAVDVARGHARGAREPHEQGVEVGAFAAEVPGLEHRPDVSDPAPAHLRVAERVLDDPVVHRPRLLHLPAAPLRDVLRRRRHDPVGADEPGGLEVHRERRLVLPLPRLAGRQQVDGSIPGGESVSHVDGGRRCAGGPLRVEDLRAVLGLVVDLRPGRIARPRVAEAPLVVRVRRERHRQPHARRSGRIEDLRVDDDLERAPSGRILHRGGRPGGPGEAAHGRRRRQRDPVKEERAPIHETRRLGDYSSPRSRFLIN